MLIEKMKQGNNIVLRISGRLDTTTAPQLRETLEEIDYSTGAMTFDFSELEYISSAGLREMMICRKKLSKERMKVINASEEVYSVFDMTGFTGMICIEKAVEDKSRYVTMSFKELLASKVSNGGTKDIVVHEGIHYTWKDIDCYSQIIAEDLSHMGVKKQTHVAICGANSANWILTFYAVQKLGAIAILLNFNSNVSEIRTLAEIGDITHFCFGEMPEMKDSESFIEEIKENNSPIQYAYDMRKTVNFTERAGEYDVAAGKFEGRVESDDPCVMLFSSGTTGRPKGVLLSAYNILNSASVMNKGIRLTQDDKICMILPLFHIFGMVGGLFSSVVADATIYIPDNIKTSTLLELITTEKCTVFHSVPTMLLAITNNKNFHPGDVASLRSTILAGAAVTEAQMIEIQKLFPNNHFTIAYGLSEMAPVTMTEYGDSIEHIATTVGKPVENIEIKIQDTSNGATCPMGKSGEIMVQGYNLMVCYYKADIDSQSIDEDGWLHTGDLGYIDENGYVHLSGRAKELIIRGGENISPNEVAGAISQEDYIADVKVVGVPHSFFGEEVAACIVLKKGETLDEENLKTALKTRLSKFKIPTYYIVFDKFPMLSNGKVDMLSLRRCAIERVNTIRGMRE